MAWTNKTKISTGANDEPILTPDGIEIFVGSAEDQVLLYQEAYTNWQTIARIASSWTLKTKIEA